MGLRENFNLAMKDLLNKGGLVGSEMSESAKSNSDLNSFLDAPSFNSADSNHSGGLGKSVYDQDTDTAPPRTAEANWQSPPFEDEPAFNAPNTAPREAEYGQMFRQAEEMTTISKNTVIVGDIKTLANITIEGNVRGKVDVMKDANIRGMLIGDLTCNNSDIRGSSIQGNILTKGSSYIDNDSILLGDLTAQFASIDGKVKGNIEIGSKIELRRNSIVAGNINTNTIAIEDGANIRGYINTAFLNEQGDNAFPKQVVINSDVSE
ncbi:polymer-forming cytoskeletal protein [Oscillospiraceae bacterium WX1]